MMVFDFSAVLVLLTLLSGAIWGLDALFLAPARRRDGVEGEPGLVEHARSFFPIFLVVLLLRSFLLEPFRIPSGSMIPTLLVGDFILVNKFTYGLRLPVTNQRFFDIGEPARGDVVVFRYPEDPSTPFIKRIVGLPGDTITYRDKRVRVNGEPLEYSDESRFVGVKSAALHTGAELLTETLGTHRHEILVTPQAPTFDGEFKVPEGQYFVLGDNRDNSRDSRYWGFVPNENLIGRAFLIWMNWDHGPDVGRIGQSIP